MCATLRRLSACGLAASQVETWPFHGAEVGTPVAAVTAWADIALNSFKTVTPTTVAECQCFMCIKVPRRLCKLLKCISGTLLVPTLSLSLLAGWLHQPCDVFLSFRQPARSSAPFAAVPILLGLSGYRRPPPPSIHIFIFLTAAAHPLSSKPVLH